MFGVEKSKKNGLSIVELMFGFLIFGILVSGIFTLFTGFEKENATINKGIQTATFESNIMLALKSPDLIRELILDLSDNFDLKNCLERGCQEGKSGSVKLNPAIDWAHRGLKLNANYFSRGSDLIELQIEITAENALLLKRSFSVYLPRRDYLKLPKRLDRLACRRGEFINGVDFVSWSPECEKFSP